MGDALESLSSELRMRFGAAIQIVSREPEALVVQAGPDEEARVSISVHDPERPAFVVCYPALTVTQKGTRRIDVVRSEGVLAAGVVWLLRQMLIGGVVRPEFENRSR